MTRQSWRLRCGDAAGFTIVGMIVAFVVLGLVLSPLVRTLLTAQEGFVTSRQRAQTASSVRYAHLALTRFMRNAGSSPYRLPIEGVDPDPGADGVFDDVRLRADYNPADGDTNDPGEDLTFYVRADTMFMRSGGADLEQPYLIGVDSLAFEYYDRNGIVITDPDRVTERAASARIVVRGRVGPAAKNSVRTLTGWVRLRNGG
jgi:type II secretory pathway pseudopilin PulG